MFDKICVLSLIWDSVVLAVGPLADNESRVCSTEKPTEVFFAEKPGPPVLEGAPRHPDLRAVTSELKTDRGKAYLGGHFQGCTSSWYWRSPSLESVRASPLARALTAGAICDQGCRCTRNVSGDRPDCRRPEGSPHARASTARVTRGRINKCRTVSRGERPVSSWPASSTHAGVPSSVADQALCC